MLLGTGRQGVNLDFGSSEVVCTRGPTLLLTVVSWEREVISVQQCSHAKPQKTTPHPMHAKATVMKPSRRMGVRENIKVGRDWEDKGFRVWWWWWWLFLFLGHVEPQSNMVTD